MPLCYDVKIEDLDWYNTAEEPNFFMGKHPDGDDFLLNDDGTIGPFKIIKEIEPKLKKVTLDKIKKYVEKCQKKNKNVNGFDISKYSWFVHREHDWYKGQDKNGNIVGINDKGEIIPLDEKYIDPYWGGADLSEVKREMKKRYKKANPEQKEKPVTWEDIEEDLKKSKNDPFAETDPEMLAYFKRQIIGHLNRAGKTKEEIKAQKEIEKKNIIPISKGKKNKK